MRTRATHRFGRLALAATLMLAGGCIDKVTAVHLTDLVGTWNLVHLNRTSATDGTTTDAMQADSGSSLVMTVSADGTLTTVTVSGGSAPANGTGTIAVSGNRGKLLLDAQPYYGNFYLKDGQLTIDCGEQTGLGEYSRITFIFAKQ